MVSFIVAMLTLASCSTKPDCTIRETSPGIFEPYGNCNNCETITVMGYNGSNRTMNMNDAAVYVQSHPPVAYTGHNSALSDMLLYSFLLNSPQSSRYQSVYAPQYNSYYNFQSRRTYAGDDNYTPEPSRYSKPVPSSRYQASSGFTKSTQETGSRYKSSSGFTKSAPVASSSYKPSGGFTKSSGSPNISSGYKSSGGFTSSSGSSSYKSSSSGYSSGYKSSSGFSSSRSSSSSSGSYRSSSGFSSSRRR